jgi:hypothetical protein
METKTPIDPETVVQQLRALRAQIPDYLQLTPASSLVLIGASNVGPHFVHASINAIGTAPIVQTAIDRTPEVMRQEADEEVRWSAVEEELRATLKGVAAANLIRRHRLGKSALLAYQISRQLVRQPAYSDLLPHVDEMKRTLRTGGRRRRKPAPPVVEVPERK